jgi:hypothetical protein
MQLRGAGAGCWQNSVVELFKQQFFPQSAFCNYVTMFVPNTRQPLLPARRRYASNWIEIVGWISNSNNLLEHLDLNFEIDTSHHLLDSLQNSTSAKLRAIIKTVFSTNLAHFLGYRRLTSFLPIFSSVLEGTKHRY